MAKDTQRDDELSTRPAVKKRLLELFQDVEGGFRDQRERSDDILDYWDMYHCILGERQFYNGNSQAFVPIVRNAIEARKTRFINQLFPQSGRFVEVTTEDGTVPYASISLVEHYVRQTRLRTQVMPALMVNGDLEGQYSVYVDWNEVTRHVVRKVTRGTLIDGVEMPELGEHEVMEEEEIVDGKPAVEVISDPDLLVLPITVDSLDEALEKGGSVTLIRRWSKAEIKAKIAAGDVLKEPGEALIKAMAKKDGDQAKDVAKENADAAGIKGPSAGKFALVYETWTKLKIDGTLRLCRAYYGGDDRVLGCKLNPFWCDLLPVISAPVKKVAGVFKGVSLVAPGVMDLQIAANDALNQALDNMSYALNPVTLVDPEKVSRWESLILDLGAVWPVGPDGAKVMAFPQVTGQALEIIGNAKNEIFQALSVNPAMMPQQTGGKGKRNQAEIANEQQVDLLTTADAVTNVEGEILTPVVQRFLEYDHQFRDDDLVLRAYGPMGVRQQMETIEPIQVNRRWELRWFGVEAARNAAQVQQQIAMANVFKGIPPQLYPGYKFNIAPLMVQMAENAFGPRLAPLVFQDAKDQLGQDPQLENRMLAEGFEVPVHPGDDAAKHLQAHLGLLAAGDQTGNVRLHIQQHQMQLQAKAQTAQQQQGQGLPGAPGGAGPGVAGSPRPGAQPTAPRQLKQPAGAIPQQSLPAAGAVPMPRKM